MPATLEGFSIVIYGSRYDVEEGLVNVPNGGVKPKLYKQQSPKNSKGDYVLEDPIAMQKRIEEDIVDIQAERVRNAWHRSLAPACSSAAALHRRRRLELRWKLRAWHAHAALCHMHLRPAPDRFVGSERAAKRSRRPSQRT